MSHRDEVRETLRLAVPIAFAQVALMTMGLVDTALVGRVSKADMAAVAIGGQLTFTALCAPMGVTMAVEPLASQAVGAGDLPRSWNALRAGVLACLLLSVPTMLVAGLLPQVLGLAGVAPALVPGAKTFVYGRLVGIPMWLLFMAAKAYLEARGATLPMLVGGWVANVLNFVVVGLLVFGDRALAAVHLPGMGLPALGALGAGLGTSFSSTVLAAIALVAAWRIRPEGATLLGGDRAELWEMARKLTRIGVPMGTQVLTEAGVFMLVGVVVGRLGEDATSAHAIAMGLAAYTYMGVMGIGSATAVRVGRAIGARDDGGPRRAGIVGIGLVVLYMGACATVFVLFSRPLAALFTPDPTVQDIASGLIRIAACFQLFDGIQGVAGGGLRGAADTRFASIANVACHWAVGLPLALTFGFALGHGARGLWWGLSAGLVVVAVVLTSRFWRLSAGRIEAV
jgi:MATE family multidrug resistance protein